MKHTKLFYILAFSMGVAGGLIAGPVAADDAPPAKWYDTLQATGYVDTYYQWNMNGLSGGDSGNINAPGSLVQRAFDVRQNEFSFSGAKVSLAGSDAESKIGGQLDLIFGPTGILVSPSGSPVEQAFVTFGLGPVSFKVGKMVTHVGYEVIETPLNLNYSRSILFMQIPFYHVGAMASVTPLDGLGVMLGLANGNSIDMANDEAKDVMAQVSCSAIAGLGLTANYYLEANRAATAAAPFENTHYMELIANYQVMKEFGLGLDYLYKTTIASGDKDEAGNALGTAVPDPETGLLKPFSPKSQGYALYVNYTTPLDGVSIIPRFEQWAAPDLPGFATDYTLTLKYAMGSLTHWLEFRSDVEGPAGFLPSAGVSEPESSQLTLTYGLTYSF